MNDFLKEVKALAVIAAYLLATIGGTWYLFDDHHILFGVTNLLLAAMAAPYFIQVVKDSWGDKEKKEDEDKDDSDN